MQIDATAGKQHPSPEYMRERLDCSPEMGLLFWKWHPSMPQKWNTRWAGKLAFTANLKGYRHGSIDDSSFLAHRVIWAIHYGVWPAEDIDHINGNRQDNRIGNLRAVSRLENNRNAARSSANTSGVTGVYWDRHNSKWKAQIQIDGRTKHLGFFTSFDETVAARKQAELDHMFHANHGRAA